MHIPPCGFNSSQKTYVISTQPRVPVDVQNILKVIGAAFAFLGSSACVFNAVAGGVNPVGATVMALALAALGIVLLTTLRKSELDVRDPNFRLEQEIQVQTTRESFIRPPVVQLINRQPVVEIINRPPIAIINPVVSIPSQTSPGMHARVSLENLRTIQSTPVVPIVSPASANNIPLALPRTEIRPVPAGMQARVVRRDLAGRQQRFNPLASLDRPPPPQTRRSAPSEDRPAPPQSDHATVGGGTAPTYARVGRDRRQQ
jgi:hypothetical protein